MIWFVVELVVAYLVIKEVVELWRAYKAKKTPADPTVPLMQSKAGDAFNDLQAKIHNWVSTLGIVADVKTINVEVKRITAFAFIRLCRPGVLEVVGADQHDATDAHFTAITNAIMNTSAEIAVS